MRSVRVLLFVLVAAGPVACADLGSAGPRPVPEWSATVELRLGSVDDPETALTSVGSVLAGADGRFYVTQPQDNTVRIYGKAGELLGRFGRQGDGPGEFRGMSAMGWWAGGKDTLWISDFQTRRVNLFLADAPLRARSRCPRHLTAR